MFKIIPVLIIVPVLAAAEVPAGTIQSNLYMHVKTLCGISPFRNYLNTASLDTAALYIRSEFLKAGTNVSFQNFTVNGREYKNVVLSIGPEDKERIIIGAHYDADGDQPGADDNASGVAGLIELAKMIGQMTNILKYRYEFAAYTLEEAPFFRTADMGSAHHAKSLAERKAKVKYMASLEMIGYYTGKRNSQKYPLDIMGLFYPDTGNYIAVVGRFEDGWLIDHFKKAISSASTLPVQSLCAPGFLTGVDFSDHLNYWKYGYNAVMITDTSFYRNGNYHLSSDTIETLDFNKMAEVVKGIFSSITN